MRRGLPFALVLCWACDGASTDEVAPEPTPAAAEPPAEAQAEAAEPAPEPEPAKTGPDLAECTAFVDHMAVVSAQSYGLPAATLFTADERKRAAEHCQQWAHPRLLECGEQAQVWSYFSNCLHARAMPRPRLHSPSREDCERFRDRTLVINNAMQSRIGGYATPSSTRSQERTVDICAQSMTTKEVQCGIAAQSNLDMLSCFSPYDVGSDRTWPTAEDCEAYGDHMLAMRDEYLLLPFPKPPEVLDALTASGLSSWMLPGVVRVQLVNLCHGLDRDMVKCHMAADAVVDVGTCVP